MRYLLDTGILIRLVVRQADQHARIRAAVRAIKTGGHTAVSTAQNRAEFWNVWFIAPPAPRSARGRLFITAARLGDANRPMEIPMSSKPVRIPGPDHPITIEPHEGRVIVKLGDTMIADTTSALTLREASYRAAHYIPRTDANMALLDASTHQSYCPYKGDASYLSAPGLPNSIWSYEQPYDAVAEIAGYLAFYPDRFTITVA